MLNLCPDFFSPRENRWTAGALELSKRSRVPAVFAEHYAVTAKLRYCYVFLVNAKTGNEIRNRP